MINKIKRFFRERKAKKMIHIGMQIEVLETLATICIYLDYDGYYSRNPYSEHLRSHFKSIKGHTAFLRKEMVGDDNA